MSEAESENGSMRAERAVAAFQSEGSRAYLTASPAPFSDPDTEPCWHDTSPVASGRHWLKVRLDPVEDRKAMILREIHFRASCFYSYLKTLGLGCMAKWTTELRALSLNQQKKSEAKGAILTLVVRMASRNWRPTFWSDSLTIENCLSSSARVGFLPWTLSFPPASALEAVSAHSC
jgi:hypothetical protein